jgi:polyferredoxin
MLNLPTTEERLGKSPQRLVRYFVLFMAIVYVSIGVWLWWTSNRAVVSSIIPLPTSVRRILGSIFIIYGLIRFGRGYQGYFRKNSSS